MFVLATACGGGGGGGGSPPAASTANLDLVIASGAGAPVSVVAVVDGIALERADGSMTANLLGQSRSVTVAHPLGAPESVALDDVPPGTYGAVHLIFRQNSGVVRDESGQERPFTLPATLRAGLDDGPATLGRGRSAWQLGHRAHAPAGAAGWTLDMTGSSGRSLVWDSVTVQVAAVDTAAGTVDVSWQGVNNGFPVRLTFDGNSVLQDRSGSLVDLATFLGALAPGGWVEVDGVLAADYTLLVRSAKPEDSAPGFGSGTENKVLGTVTAVDPATSTLDVQVLVVQRGSAVSPNGALPVLTVDASQASIYRSDTAWVPLAFGDLRVGDCVEVEWRGPVNAGRVVAHEVELEDRSGASSSSQVEVEGQVDTIDVAGGEIRMVPRSNDPIVFDGRTWPAARVRLDASTLLYLDDPSRPIPLAQVTAGMRIWVKGARSSGTSQGELELSGSRVRVRN